MLSATFFAPPQTLRAILVLSVLALAAALTAEFYFHLPPCILCLAQRVPFAIAIILSAVALRAPRIQTATLWVLAVLFVTNTGIAIFQVGEEQAWWGLNAAGNSQACTAPNVAVQNVEDLYQSMSGTALGDCAHPSFKWHGITFAGINGAFCLLLAAFAAMGAFNARRKT